MSGIGRSVPAAALIELERLYAAADERLAKLGFSCRMDGACCRFDRSGLSLFASLIEAYHLFSVAGAGGAAGGAAGCGPRDGSCPFLDGDGCSRRTLRTLGCRTYACDSAVQEAAETIYEEFHLKIRRLHDRFDLPYEYLDLRAWADRFARAGGPSSRGGPRASASSDS